MMTIVRRTDEGDYARLGHPPDLFTVRATSGLAATGGAVAAVLPLDGDLPLRLEAVLALWRRWRGRTGPPPDPLTPARRRRAALLIRVADARAAGATQREIGVTCLRLPAELSALDWKNHPLRSRTLHLIRDARALLAGGYRRLLRR
jgi:hypothetical protein